MQPPKKLRIIQAVNVRWYNATAWYGISLAGLLSGAGHEVRVLALPGTEPFRKAADINKSSTIGIYTNLLFGTNTIRNFFLMQNLIRSFKPHVVNCHRGEGMAAWGLLKAFLGGFALVRTRGDQRPPKANLANRLLYANLSEAVIATNSRTERQCASLLGVAASKLHLIPGGVDRTFFSPDQEGRERVRRECGFSPDDLVVGIVGRFDPVKGHRDLLDAAARLRAESPQGAGRKMRLLLMGFPANISVQEMRGMIRERGLEDCCVITGKVNDVPAHISAMDVGVVASNGSEAIARAAFEIMSCGVPLIGADVGVMPDLLADDALFPAGDADALAARLKLVAENEDFRQRLRAEQAGRMPAFSSEAFLEKTLSVYYAAVKQAGITI